MNLQTELIFQIFFQIVTAILSLFFYKKHKSIFYKLLCIFLIVVAITESIGIYQIKYDIIDKNNIHLISAFFQFNLIALMYSKLLNEKTGKKIILFLSFLFNFYFVFVFFNKSLFPFLIAIGCINSGLFSFLYLRKLLMSDKIINYKEHLPFWVSVAFLIFYITSIPFFTEMAYMQGRDLFFLVSILIIIMNLLIITGIIWSKKEVKY